MSIENLASKNFRKVIELSPFKGSDYVGFERGGQINDLFLRLYKIPGLDVEENLYLNVGEEDTLDQILPPFAYSRFVDKEGQLHYWRIQMPPILIGNSVRSIENLVEGEPTLEMQKKMINSLKNNLPKLSISPDEGIVMNFVEGISLQITPNGNFETDINGLRHMLKKPKDTSNETHYQTEEMKLNIEEYVFDDKRRDNIYFYTHGIIKYINLDIDEILEKLQKHLQMGFITESMVRQLVNPLLHVSIESTNDDNEQALI